MTSPLLERAQGGDERAFQELTAPYVRELHLHCYRMLGSVTDADDLLQEILLAAWTGLGGFAGRSSVRTWLYRIATNRCLNAIRDGKRRPPTEPLPPFDPPEPTRRGDITWLQPYPDSWLEDLAVRRETVELAFVTALQRLPPRQAATLVLVDVLGFTTTEVADLMDTTPTAIKGALQRARASARRESGAGVALASTHVSSEASSASSAASASSPGSVSPPDSSASCSSSASTTGSTAWPRRTAGEPAARVEDTKPSCSSESAAEELAGHGAGQWAERGAEGPAQRGAGESAQRDAGEWPERGVGESERRTAGELAERGAGEWAVARRFAAAFVADDIEAVTRLLTDEAWLAMPPAPHEYQGAAAIAEFLRASADADGRRGARLRLEASGCNRQPGFRCYFVGANGVSSYAGRFVLTVDGERISRITRFLEPALEKVLARDPS